MFDRQRLHVGSRVMLPTYTILYLALGFTFTVQSPKRTSTGAFVVATQLMPIRAWGFLFLVSGLVMLAAAAFRNLSVVVRVLVLAAGICAFWAVLLFVSAAQNPSASFTASYWVAGMAVAHFASARAVASARAIPGGGGRE